MIIDGRNYRTLDVFPSMMTVPDCVVVGSNKLGRGHGEAKFYIASKNEMYNFYGAERFVADVFMRKSDLVSYMEAVKNEYMNPSQDYAKKDELPILWKKRYDMIQQLDDIIYFKIYDQNQIAGPRGYINSKDDGYKIIREIALPLVSYIYAEKVGTEDSPLFYWKLFVDYQAIWERQNGPLVFNYGRSREQHMVAESEFNYSADNSSKKEEVKNARIGQGKYRKQLLEDCPFCPITKIADDRLLIASHIKPWSACENDEEKIDRYNGYILSPLYDKLFDQGYITFTNERHMITSKVISQNTWERMGIKDDTFIQQLPMDNKREIYLDFHRKNVFKGNFEY